MAVETREITFITKGNCDVLDVTSQISEEIKQSGVNNGIVTIFVPGSTGGLSTIEYESGLVSDIKEAMERIAPQGIEYKHNLKWKDGNGHSHIRASIVGPSITIPFTKKKMLLGTWQQIIFLDFDNCSRNRRLILQIIGE
ncbi:MAG: secondary thiamine-phosphate synthase enzyme YjbQ [Candidatus Eremiobacterota bacterium]